MLKIKIVSVGKIKNKAYKTLNDEFLKRLKPYAMINSVELPHGSFISESDKGRVVKVETEKFLKIIKKNEGSFVVALDESGSGLSSVGFADFFKETNSEVLFLISGTLGFDDSIKKAVDMRLSLSEMTFPHEMARVILLEQIYRSATIINQKKYHY